MSNKYKKSAKIGKWGLVIGLSFGAMFWVVDGNDGVTDAKVLGATNVTATAIATSDVITVTETPNEQQEVDTTEIPAATPIPEVKGWNTTDTGKKYYIKKDGKRASGYTKIKNDWYYFGKKGYMLSDSWKYVKIGEKKYKLYFAKNGKQKQNVSSLIGEQSSYRAEVNIKKNVVIIYAKDDKGNYCIPVKAMVCSCGIKGHSTITGTYSRLSKAGKWHTLFYGAYGKYCTRISGHYLFHSVIYKKNGDSHSLDADEYEKLGTLASHGCIRLEVKDAKWIYKRAKKITTHLYKSSEKLPLKKPTVPTPVREEDGKAYDPTDSDVK